MAYGVDINKLWERVEKCIPDVKAKDRGILVLVLLNFGAILARGYKVKA